MYMVNFIFKNSATTLPFAFNSFVTAEAIYKQALGLVQSGESVFLSVADDFESRAAIDATSIAAVNFVDVDADFKRAGDVQILQAKATMRTQSQAKNDPVFNLMSTARSIATQ